MKKEAIATAKTIEEAVKNACAQMEAPEEDVVVEVLEYPKKGFLGLGGSMAKVKVTFEQEEPKAAETSGKAEAAIAFLEELFAQMGLTQVEIAVDSQEDHAVSLSLSGDEVGVVIGRRGETMDAVQYLTGLVVNRLEGEYFRVNIDSGGYREKRAKTLENLALRLAKNAVRTGKSATLEPMNPYERRIIHSTVQTVEGAASHSIGDEPGRRVVITSLNPPPRRRSGGRGDRDSRPRSGEEIRRPRPSHPVAGYRKPYGGRTQYAQDNVKDDEESPRYPDYDREPSGFEEESGPVEKNAVELESGGLYGKIEI